MTTRRRYLLGLAGLLVIVLTVAAGVAWVLQPSRITRENFDALREGMTLGEVETVLGGPARNEVRGAVDVWVPRGEERRSAGISPGGPLPSFLGAQHRGLEEHVWLGREGLIAAAFDADGRLKERYFSTVHGLDDGIVAKVARKFGW